MVAAATAAIDLAQPQVPTSAAECDVASATMGGEWPTLPRRAQSALGPRRDYPGR